MSQLSDIIPKDEKLMVFVRDYILVLIIIRSVLHLTLHHTNVVYTCTGINLWIVL